ncbi:hypothetical protein NX059_008002 [Plenodomus lindquistii]|nr:hypothetical protein NX059_008002 [Plenodomus lindquistii]
MQAVLGSADISWDGDVGKHKSQYIMDTQFVFKNVSSLIRCIIDCQIQRGDSTSIHSAMLLERSLGSKAWDDSPLQMRQIDGIGVVAVRKLANAGIRSMDDLEATEAHRIEALVGRNPPFGLKTLEKVRQFPKLRISLQLQPSSVRKTPDGVEVKVKADIGFINERPPLRFANKPVYVCLLADTSNGRKIHFARISGQKLGSGQSLIFPALLTSHDQSINCYVMCDGVAGSLRNATLKPQVAPALFPSTGPSEPDPPHRANVSKRRNEVPNSGRRCSVTSDDFDDDGIDDDALLNVSLADLEFDHIENYANPTNLLTRENTVKNKNSKAKTKGLIVPMIEDGDDQPVQLHNGKWACNHPCKDKTACKHLCCKNGMDKPPKKKVGAKSTPSDGNDVQLTQMDATPKAKHTQTKLQLTTSKRKSSGPVEELDLTQQEKKKKANHAMNGPSDYRGLHQLHKTVQRKKLPDSLHSVMHTKPAYCYSQGGEHNLSFLDKAPGQQPQPESEYSNDPPAISSPHPSHPQKVDPQNDRRQLYDVPGAGENTEYLTMTIAPSRASDDFDDGDSLLDDAMIGVVDSQDLQGEGEESYDVTQALEDALNLEYETGFDIEDSPEETGVGSSGHNTHHFEHVGDEKTSSLSMNAQQSSYFDRNHSCTNTRGAEKRPERELQPRLSEQPEPVLAAPQHARTTSKDSYDNALGSDIIDLIDSFDAKPTGKAIEADNKQVLDAFRDLEPWLIQEFGDIVELVDG